MYDYVKGQSGVYSIRHTENDKQYIGSSVDIQARLYQHFWHLGRGTHRCTGLQNAYNKYGSDKFIAGVLEVCESDQLVVREQWWIDQMKAADARYGYNSKPTAYSNIGYVHSAESKAKLSAAMKGRVVSAETGALISKINKERNSVASLRAFVEEHGNPNQKLRESDLEHIFSLKESGYTNKEIGQRYGVSHTTIGRALRGVCSYGPGREPKPTPPLDLDTSDFTF